MNAWKVILATLVIFIAGVVTGTLLATLTMRVLHGGFKPANNNNRPLAPAATAAQVNPWQTRNKELLRRMDRDLELTPEQHARIERIMSASAERTKVLWKPIAPLMNREMQQVRAEIGKELTPEQRKKFEGFPKVRQGLDKRRNSTNAPPSIVTTNMVSSNAVPAAP